MIVMKFIKQLLGVGIGPTNVELTVKVKSAAEELAFYLRFKYNG